MTTTALATPPIIPAPDAVVYLVCQPTVKKDGALPNLEPLKQWGRVVTLLDKDARPSRDPQQTLEALEAGLKDFDESRDFLVWAGGDSLALVMVGTILESWEVLKITWLRYQKVRLANGVWTDEGAAYIPTTVDLDA